MKKIIVPFIIIGVTTLIASCHTTVSEDERISERVDSFATYYFNWQYDKAAAYCTPPSIKWLEFAARFGEPPAECKEGIYEWTLVKEKRAWLIRMEALPRNEKQNHD